MAAAAAAPPPLRLPPPHPPPAPDPGSKKPDWSRWRWDAVPASPPAASTRQSRQQAVGQQDAILVECRDGREQGSANQHSWLAERVPCTSQDSTQGGHSLTHLPPLVEAPSSKASHAPSPSHNAHRRRAAAAAPHPNGEAAVRLQRQAGSPATAQWCAGGTTAPGSAAGGCGCRPRLRRHTSCRHVARESGAAPGAGRSRRCQNVEMLPMLPSWRTLGRWTWWCPARASCGGPVSEPFQRCRLWGCSRALRLVLRLVCKLSTVSTCPPTPAVEHEVHRVQRLEHRLQKRAAALPESLRRLLAGGIAVKSIKRRNRETAAGCSSADSE